MQIIGWILIIAGVLGGMYSLGLLPSKMTMVMLKEVLASEEVRSIPDESVRELKRIKKRRFLGYLGLTVSCIAVVTGIALA